MIRTDTPQLHTSGWELQCLRRPSCGYPGAALFSVWCVALKLKRLTAFFFMELPLHTGAEYFPGIISSHVILIRPNLLKSCQVSLSQRKISLRVTHPENSVGHRTIPVLRLEIRKLTETFPSSQRDQLPRKDYSGGREAEPKLLGGLED